MAAALPNPNEGRAQEVVNSGQSLKTTAVHVETPRAASRPDVFYEKVPEERTRETLALPTRTTTTNHSQY
ncbi:hypothetical protein NDU88_004490 [Pleurodeles waltl]|uniref:Uncharacterized protein n=1 Tax=Pleurodeles waltl TaxID=8319 RepID=A0AAV7L0G6_PLEWA|nr:hypothetical protein NDU88_004490 [Pleurodeles waltl]